MAKKDLQYYLNLPWSYRFVWSDEDAGYVASIQELKGCVSFGETLEEAAFMIKDALSSYIETSLKYNDTIPEPVAKSKYKGKIAYRTTAEKHYKLAQLAKSMGTSINSLIDEAITSLLKIA